jgi:hypothetical protein
MKNVPENELFSAYLDGELTAEEQAQVEQVLGKSPSARQLLDELSAVSDALQSLPAQSVGEDLGPAVLEKAERRMLGGSGDGQPGTGDGAANPWHWHPRRLLNPRIWAWPALAAAIALGMMLLNTDQQPAGGPQVAEAPAVEQPPAFDQTAAEADRSPDSSREPPAMRALPEPETASSTGVPEEEDAGGERGAVEESAPSIEPAEGASPAAEAEAAAPPSAMADSLRSDTASEEHAATETDEAAEPVAHGAAASRADESGGVDPGAEGPPRRAVAKAEEAEMGGPEAAAPPKPALAADSVEERPEETPAAPAAADPAELADNGEADNATEGVEEPSDREPPAGMRADRPASAAPPPAEGVLVVQCDIHPKAARSGVFDRILSRQQIALDKPPAEVARTIGAPTGGDGAGEPSDPAKADEGPEDARDSAVGGRPADDALDVVYVEATTAQINATLADLARRPKEFVSVQVQPHPSQNSQQQFRRFSRVPGSGTPANSSLAADAERNRPREKATASRREVKSFSLNLGRAKRLNVPGAGFAAPAGNASGGTVAIDGSEGRAAAAGSGTMPLGGGVNVVGSARATLGSAAAKATHTPAEKTPDAAAGGKDGDPMVPPQPEAATADGVNAAEKAAEEKPAERAKDASSAVETHRVLFVLRVVEPGAKAGATSD